MLTDPKFIYKVMYNDIIYTTVHNGIEVDNLVKELLTLGIKHSAIKIEVQEKC